MLIHVGEAQGEFLGGEVDENSLATVIVDAAYKVHKALGPGLLESVYTSVLAYELEQRGLEVVREPSAAP